MSAPDPIAPVISALSILVTPNPAPAPPTYPQPVGNATPGTLYTPIQTLLGVLFGVSADLTSVSKGINTALTDVAKVVSTIATNLATVGSLADVTKAMTALQNSLSLAQALAPGSTTVVLNSASALFQQIQNLLSSVGSMDQATGELAELSQQLTALAELFPTS